MNTPANARPASLYRQAALRRLSSPLHLDGYLSVASPANWLVLVAVFLMIGATAVWAWKGTITQTAVGQGILVGAGGVVSINAPAGGQVVSVEVKAGDTVAQHQVIARIANPILAEQVRLAEVALTEAQREADRNVRLRSEKARLEIQAQDAQRRNLEREIVELEHQTLFAAEQMEGQQALFADGIVVKSVVVAAEEKLASIRLDIAHRRSQIEQLQADRFSAQANVADAAAESRQRVTDLERRLEALREELSQTTTARTEYAGKVIETKIYAGAVVAPGIPMVTIQPTEGQLQAVVYIPSRQAKFVLPDMEVQLSPSNTRPEEHGYLRAKVLTVAAFPVSPLAITRSLENEALTTAMTSEGPVTELHIALLVDAADPSGYRWSSRRGGRVSLSTGTLCTARIIVARKRPLALAVPALREALGFD